MTADEKKIFEEIRKKYGKIHKSKKYLILVIVEMTPNEDQEEVKADTEEPSKAAKQWWIKSSAA